ncbi:HAD family hydrolase [Cellulomonas sp. NPDC089187]|uniref:Cof-type HAD-IIB family hydrolase n=1 Tax=Cellulomonas sp. NPDC089187 TaxID=3154970 RepID=UPI0034403380
MPTPVMSPPALPDTDQIRLIATDMDGSLLDGDGRIPTELWPLLDELDRRGIAFVPASGRQYANIREQFGERGKDLVCIGENGAYVGRGEQVLSTTALPEGIVPRAVQHTRELAAAGLPVGVVVSGARSAYVEHFDGEFAAQVRKHYALVTEVPDLTRIDDVLLKVAVHDAGLVEERTAGVFADVEGPVRVLVSGQHWLDLMSPDADKGVALRAVQEDLGIGPEHTMAFGDYRNDLGMLAAARWSCAMDNAHPDVRTLARYVVPANTQHGVVATIAATLGLGR